ncbi:MAG: cytochrome c3 family protein, partial [Phycisphaerae bacterium]
LRITTRLGALCTTCHQMDGWRACAHATAAQPIPAALRGFDPPLFTSMADNGCSTCHVAHGAAQHERLLRARSYDLCTSCHDGSAGQNILAAIGQRSAHRPGRFLDRHDPDEDPRTMRPHVDCVDCHNPHAAQANPAGVNDLLARTQGSLYTPTLQHVPGVSLSGAPVDEVRRYYEVCFRCHADNPVLNPRRIVRDRDERGNIRRQFLPTAASAHPIAFAARGSLADVPSLLPAARAQASMNCQDCHNNPDARQLGGGGANGPHGSRFEFLLVERYETADFTSESPQAYALCYRCHDRSSILGDESFTFHNVHVVRGRAPCSACHTAHGVNGSATEHSHLINFDVRIVSGERQFVDRGQRAGSCTLTCHGVRHVNFTYGP